MKWTKDKSIKLSIVCVFVFAAILLALDIWTVWGWIAPNFELRTQLQWQYYVMFTATVASGSICAWICLWALYRLLKNIQAGRVFTEDTVKLLRIISWCCAGACLVFLASVLYYPPFMIIAAAAAFMMMIVRVVKNIIQQAIDMKAELDLTV